MPTVEWQGGNDRGREKPYRRAPANDKRKANERGMRQAFQEREKTEEEWKAVYPLTQGRVKRRTRWKDGILFPRLILSRKKDGLEIGRASCRERV